MLTQIIPKLPMRSKAATERFYVSLLGFKKFGSAQFDGYLMLERDGQQIHFFEFVALEPKENYGQVYIRVDDIATLYQSYLDSGVTIHPNGTLRTKAWGQTEFSVLDVDNNLLTFGQSVII
jgi:hypothetical protein